VSHLSAAFCTPDVLYIMVSKTNLPTVKCKNLQSPFRNPDIVDNLIKQEVEKGYLKGAFEKPPF
jgi:hypothetical protein